MLDRDGWVEDHSRLSSSTGARPEAQDATASGPTLDLVAHLNAAMMGRYQVERRLGEGGMATVYLARDLRHGRDVALKVLKPEVAAAIGAERFLAEIQTTARLQHPHILPLFDSGEADGSLFYVMPSVSGESLAQRLDRERQLPVVDAVQISSDVADALDYAHRNGVIHRDIKPANILLRDGRALVADFGIALAASHGAGRLTATGFAVGTFQYMSPEQATGDLAVGPPTDIWALGCVLYEMLVGEPPYGGSTQHAILGKVVQARPVSASQARRTIPPNVDATIRRALEKIPADRFSTAGGFAAALRDPNFRHGETDSATRTTTPRAAAQTVLLMGLGILLGAVASAAWLSALTPPDPAEVMRFALPMPANSALDTRTIGQDLAISPDGKLIAYVGRTANGADVQIHLRPIGELSGVPLRGGEGGMNPFFSPDGQSIGFVDVGNPRSLRRVPTSGGRAETIATLPLSVNYIAGAAWTGDEIIVGTGQSAGLYRVPLDGNRAERLTEGQHHWPSLVAGRDAVLLMDHAAGQHLAVLDLRTGEAKALGLEGTSPRYVPTGHLVYATADGSLWGVAFDATRLEVSGNPVLLLEGIEVKTATESAANFGISSTGHLVFASGGTATSLVAVTAAGARSVLLQLDAWSAYPRFSPDGGRLAYAASTGDGSGKVDLWVLDLGRGSQTRVTFDGDNRFFGAWTPDGKRLTHARRFPSTQTLSTFADGTGNADILLDGDAAGLPTSWTPDGRTLAYDMEPQRSSTSSWDVGVLHTGGDSVRTEPILQTAFAERSAIFSPDGAWVVYVSDKSGQNNVYARPFPGPGTEITISSGSGTEPRWSPSGNEIYYRRGDDLLAVAVEKRGPELMLGTPRSVQIDRHRSEGFGVANYDVSPKDGQIVVVEDVQSSAVAADRLYVVLNWLTELRARFAP
jgi:serine/threonine-protein kinase